MTAWQRRARLVIGLAAVAFAAVLAFQFKGRAPATAVTPVPQTDAEAIAQTDRGRSRRFNFQNEEVSIEYAKLLSYADGSSRMMDLKVVTTRAGGRLFTVTANEGHVGKDDSEFEFTGDVHVVSDDGMDVSTDHATYHEAEGIVRAEGPVQFARGALTGSGTGAVYDKNRDLLTVLDKVTVRMPPDEAGKGRVEVDAGGAEFARTEHLIRFERRMVARQESGTLEADTAFAHLSADEKQMEALDLRGNSRITGGDTGPGTLKSLVGQDIDLQYAAAGIIQHAAIRGAAAIDVSGDKGQAARQIAAHTLDIALAADGATPTAVIGRTAVKLTIPATKADPARTITADAMDTVGNEKQGLTGAHFTGSVKLEERAKDVSRTATSQVLDVVMGPAFSSIDDARFTRMVRFEDSGMIGTAAAARYVLAKGTLELTGSEPGSVAPRVVNDRMDTTAARIDVTLAGPVVHARGAVQSTLRAPKTEAGRPAPADAPKMPSMLKSDQDVSVTADDLAYDGTLSRAKYSGNAVLFQGETKIKASWIGLDDQTGNLSAGEGVTTTTWLKQDAKSGAKERVLSTGTAKEFLYEDDGRKATYTSTARLVGPQGDVRADKIVLFLKPSGDEVERAEARGNVTVLDEKKRKSSGDELTFFSVDDRYEMKGKPVVVIDQCGTPTEGLTLTFFKATDRVILNGTAQNLTRTRSDGAACP